MDYKKKLYKFRPGKQLTSVETYRTRRKLRLELCDSKSIERDVRQLLSDKVNGTMMGLWLLVPEHLRLGTWDLLRTWTAHSTEDVEPRLALQLVHEAALCVTGIRQGRSLSQKGFELVNGLPFVASDMAIHQLLNGKTVSDSLALQVMLGRLRQASGHFKGKILAIDPHHLKSYTKRQTVRCRKNGSEKSFKTAQTFFCLDADTNQPVAFTIGSSARTVTQAMPELVQTVESILNSKPDETLILADTQHYCAKLFDYMTTNTPYSIKPENLVFSTKIFL